MKSLRSLAILVLLALVAAACGGGGGADSARARLGAAPRAGGSPAESPSGPAAPAAESPAPAGDSSAAPATPGASTSAGVAKPSGTAPSGAAPSAGRASAGAGAASEPATASAAGPSGGGGSTPGPGPGGSPVPGVGVPGAPSAGDRTGVTDTEVVFGMHQPLSGPVGFLLKNSWHGAQAYFNSVNDAGGVNGRKIRFVVADDGYDSQKAAGAIRELVDTKEVFAASCLAGVDQCVVGLEYANSKGVPYVHAGMRESIVQKSPWSFPTTTSYPYGAERLADYMFTKRGYTPARKIGALYINSVNFDEMAQRFEKHLATYGSKFTVKYPVEKDQSDYSAGITKMQNAGIDTVWFHTDPTVLAKFVSQARLLNFKPQYVFTAPVGGDLYAEGAGGGLDKAFGLASFAGPRWSGAAKLRETYRKYYRDEEPDEFSIVAFVDAMVFTEGLRRAGRDLGRDSFARGMLAIDLFDTGISSPLSYAKRSRVGAANSTMAVMEIHGTSSDQMTGFEF